MSSLSYDNASNMSGVYKGAQSRILAENPLALYSPCACHSLNLCGEEAAQKCIEAVTFFGIVQKCYNVFSSSPQRPPSGAVVYPAAERNAPHILACLKKYILPASDKPQILLEVASGTGQHSAHFSPNFPHVVFQPTEFEPRLLNSIEAYRNHLKLSNMKEAAILDVTQPPDIWLQSSLPQNSLDYILSVNMIHISPWACTKGLFAGAGYLLKPGGYLFMYGPFAVDGNITPESNVNFDKSLRAQNGEWGLRDLTRQLVPLANDLGLRLANTHDLPANNKFIAWLKQGNLP